MGSMWSRSRNGVGESGWWCTDAEAKCQPILQWRTWPPLNRRIPERTNFGPRTQFTPWKLEASDFHSLGQHCGCFPMKKEHGAISTTIADGNSRAQRLCPWLRMQKWQSEFCRLRDTKKDDQVAVLFHCTRQEFIRETFASPRSHLNRCTTGAVLGWERMRDPANPPPSTRSCLAQKAGHPPT